MAKETGSRYHLPDLSAGCADADDPLESRSWPERRDVIYEEDEASGEDETRPPPRKPLDRETLLALWKDVPPMDPDALRRDVDSAVDQSL